jgi:hypothetical protein
VHLPQGAAYIPGEVMNSIVEINNSMHIRIKRIECHVEITVEVGDDSYTVDVVKITLSKIIDINEAIRKETFEIELPQDLTPSYKYSMNIESQQT